MMRTWSIAGFIDRLIDAAHTVERVSRPVRRERDGAEELAEREAEEECSEATEIDVRLVGFTSCGQDMESYARGFNEGFDEAQRQQDPDWSPDDDAPNPPEPSLTDDEVVALRGLIQERYEDAPDDLRPKWLLDLIDTTVEWASDALGQPADDIRAAIWRDKPPCDHRYCEKQGYGLCFGVRAAMIDFNEDTRISPAVSADARVSAAESGSTPPSSPSVACTDPSPTRQSGYGPSLGGEGAAADSGHSPVPPAAAQPPWSDLADALVEHRPSAKAEEPDAVAVIREVLAEHESHGCRCACEESLWGAATWREHVAPLIAEALEPHRIYVKRGPMGEPVPVELRPDEGIDSAADRRVTQHRKHLK